MQNRLVASVLNADLARLGEVCTGLEEAGLHAIQWDVMDGHFVPNLTVGAAVIAACRAATDLPFEAHLMIAAPEPYLSEYVDAGCETIIVHAETCTHLHRTLEGIHDLGAKPGLALNPSTPLHACVHVIDLLDLLLVMTVNPGFGGQSYIAAMDSKIAAARELIAGSGRDVSLEVDGGISPLTIAQPAAAGADRFVVGSALYKQGDPAAVVNELKLALDSS
ncbi:MAG: ribulose-phosphate 3-epimerase [Actinomycetota bacterium]|nr:ribulose-phosphate 3-epimerase [Actinomycetota bacterium]